MLKRLISIRRSNNVREMESKSMFDDSTFFRVINMKIQLITSPPLDMKKSSDKISGYPPLGILYLASYVRQFHPEIKWKISDGYANTGVISDFKSFKPDIVGVSYNTPFATGAFKLMKIIRELDPSVKIVAGGAHPTAMPDESLKFADAVVVGEGEQSFLKIIENDLSGIVKNEYIKDLDTIPFPARDLINMKDYFGNILKRKSPETSIISSRGCAWSQCWFCSEMWKICKPYCRVRSPKNVADEIEMLTEKYKIKELYDQAEEINIGSTAEKLCDEIISRKLDISWKACLRCDNLDDNLMEKLHKSGCWLIYLGMESGNQRTLDGIRKGIKLEQIVNACKVAKRHDVKVVGYFMVFNAWEENGKLANENINDCRNTFKFAKKLLKDKLLYDAGFQITTPMPLSLLWGTANKFNLIPEELKGKWEEWGLAKAEKIVMKLPDVTDDDYKTIKNEIYRLWLIRNIKNINLSLVSKVALRYLTGAFK
jgi:radical SAM superfamily enzyme YgiQ (UPF0313 family)